MVSGGSTAALPRVAITVPAPAAPRARANGRAPASAGDGTDDSADGGHRAYFCGVLTFRSFAVLDERLRFNRHVLAVGSFQLYEFDREIGQARHFAGALRADDAAFEPRAAFGDHKAVGDQRLIQGGGEGVAGLIALAG